MIVGGAGVGDGVAAYSIVAANGSAGGLISLPNGDSHQAAAGALAPDGSVILASNDWQSLQTIHVAKLTNAGDLDTTFGTGGITSVSFTDADKSAIPGMVVRPNGKIVLGGGWAIGPSVGYGILQLDGVTGAPDTSLGLTGTDRR